MLTLIIANRCGAGDVPLPRLSAPIPVLAAGKPIAVSSGHAAPCVIDLDRDGKKPLRRRAIARQP